MRGFADNGLQKKTPNNAQTDSSTISSQPKVSSVVESTSSAVSSAEPVSSVSSKPPAESMVSSAPSQPAPAPKPTPSSSANSSYCQACSGLSPPSYYACRAHKIKTDAFEISYQMRLFFYK